MRWSDIPRQPSSTVLRQFALLWIVCFGGTALWRYLVAGDSGTGTTVLAMMAVIVGASGLLVPATVRPIFVGWMMLVFPIGWAVSRVLLLLTFGLLITPIAVFFRLRRRDPLQLRPDRERESYWSPKPPPGDLGGYFRQY